MADEEVLTWHGDVDLSAVTLLREELATALAAQPVTLRIDLSNVSFMDSMGVGLLLEARVDAIRAGVQLELHGVDAAMRNLLDSMGVLDLFDVH